MFGRGTVRIHKQLLRRVVCFDLVVKEIIYQTCNIRAKMRSLNAESEKDIKWRIWGVEKEFTIENT